MAIWLAVLLIIIGLVAGAVAGFFIARKQIKAQFRKNPPINESMIRQMYSQVGRKPKEADIKKIITMMNKNLK